MAGEDIDLRVNLIDRRNAARELARIDGALDRTGRSASRAGRAASSSARGFDRLRGGVRGLAGVAWKGLAGGLTAFAGAAVAGGAFLKGAFSEAQDAQKVGRLTASAIKATGGAANVSAKQVENLAGAISAKAGIDDEAIQSGANMILTFKNVRNELGKGNAIFDRATQSAVDLSAAGFGSISSQSKSLAKALNDPIKGVASLGKSGVTFSEDQKAMIASLVETGDVLGAQKIILKEVEGQVGGAAASQASAADKMKVAWGNLQEQVGTALMPVFEKVFGFISDKVVPTVSAFVDGIQDGTGAGGRFREIMTAVYERGVKPVGNFIKGTVVPAVREFISGMRDGTGIGGRFADFARGLGDTLRPIGLFIRDTLWPAVKKFIGEMNSGQGAGGTFVDILTKVWGAAKRVADFVIRTLIPNLAEFARFVMSRVVPVILRIAGAWLSMALFGVRSFRILLQGAFKAFGGILAGAEAALGWIPEFGDKIRGARATFDAFGTQTIDKLKGVEAGLVKARDRANELAQNRSASITVTTYFESVGTPNKAARDAAIIGAPPLAKGGPVVAGRPYIVGDGGRPELFVPEQNGRVLPRVGSYRPTAGDGTSAAHRELDAAMGGGDRPAPMRDALTVVVYSMLDGKQIAESTWSRERDAMALA